MDAQSSMPGSNGALIDGSFESLVMNRLLSVGFVFRMVSIVLKLFDLARSYEK